MNIGKIFMLTAIWTSMFAAPALAKGMVTVEYTNGDVDEYPEVNVAKTNEAIYLKPVEGENVLVVVKKNCKQEQQLQVCTDAEVKLNTYGVDEDIEVEQVVIFINDTSRRQKIQGSQVNLSPNTVLLEILTDQGTYITGVGRIDGDVSLTSD